MQRYAIIVQICNNMQLGYKYAKYAHKNHAEIFSYKCLYLRSIDLQVQIICCSNIHISLRFNSNLQNYISFALVCMEERRGVN